MMKESIIAKLTLKDDKINMRVLLLIKSSRKAGKATNGMRISMTLLRCSTIQNHW